MSGKENKLEISGQFLHCPLLLSIDTYEGCLHGCRYCFANFQYKRQNKGRPRSEFIRPALLTSWERVINGEKVGNPMVEYLVRERHPIQLGTKSDPFPAGVEPNVKNTARFIEMCNRGNYPVYICTKNTNVKDMPVDLLAKGNYVLGVSLASHKNEHIKKLEKNTIPPLRRLRQIPKGVFKKIIIKWHPFIPQLFTAAGGKKREINWVALDSYLDEISAAADAVSLSFLSYAMIGDRELLQEIGSNLFSELEEVSILAYIKEQAHRRNLEFYTVAYRALSDSPVCCGFRADEFPLSAPWVWAHLIWKLFTGEKEYLTKEDIIEVFPDELKDKMFCTMDIPPFSRWARYMSNKTTILEEYIRNFTRNRKKNPVNFFAGLYSRVVDGEFRVYFKDYRKMVAV